VCEIQIHSTLPTAAGLGSSASTSVALTRALSTFLGHPFENDIVNQIAFEIEKIHHGTPSGIDNTVITYEKILFFIKSKPNEFLQLKKPLTLVIADSGIKSSTVKVVDEVKQHFLADQTKYTGLFDHIAEISLAVKKSLKSGSIESVGKLLKENHSLLQHMGVSCPKLDELVACAMEHGALGAKLSGGGKGGNMIALVKPENAESIAIALKSAGAVNTIITHVPARG
jgi:mevalonate kinase